MPVSELTKCTLIRNQNSLLYAAVGETDDNQSEIRYNIDWYACALHHWIMELTNCTISRSMSGSKSTVL
jgi:hypothetical protein